MELRHPTGPGARPATEAQASRAAAGSARPNAQQSTAGGAEPDLQSFTLFATDKKHRRIKVICRYQQYETANKMVARVVAGYPKKGLIWHFQGSGKSLLMVFAAQKLRLAQEAENAKMMELYKKHVLKEPESNLVQIGGIQPAAPKAEETTGALGD